MSSTAAPLSDSSTIGAMATEATVNGSCSTCCSSTIEDVLRTSAPALATRAPQPNANEQQRHRLGLEPVEPEERRYDDAERQHREDQPEQRGLHAGIGADGSGEDEAAHGEADQDHRELHASAGSSAGWWR